MVFKNTRYIFFTPLYFPSCGQTKHKVISRNFDIEIKVEPRNIHSVRLQKQVKETGWKSTTCIPKHVIQSSLATGYMKKNAFCHFSA